MASIAQVTRELVSRQPFLEDALARGIINYNALAEELRPKIEERVGRKVQPASISMSLRRLSQTVKKNQFERIEKHLQEFVGSDTTIKYDLFELTIRFNSNEDPSEVIGRLYESGRYSSNDFLSLTKGTSELSIIANLKHRDFIKKLVNPKSIKSEVLGLAALSVFIPEDSLQIPGLFYYFTKALTTEGINIIELISTFSEIQFIVDEPDVLETSKIIRSLIRTGIV